MANPKPPIDVPRLVRGLSSMQRTALKHTVEKTEPTFKSRADYGGYAVARRALQRKGLIAFRDGAAEPTPLGRDAHSFVAAHGGR